MKENESSITGIIDLICDEFEESWKEGKATNIESSLEKV